MIIIANYIQCIITFVKTGKVLSAPVRSCFSCGYMGCLHRHGCYSRNLITFKKCYRVTIQRYKCPSCGKTCSVRLFFILPYFQYSYFVILAVLFRSFVCKQSYNRIILSLRALSPWSSITSSHLSFYCNRFKRCYPQIRLFFISVGIFHEEDFNQISAVKAIVNFSVASNFPYDYHDSFHKFFMQKP